MGKNEMRNANNIVDMFGWEIVFMKERWQSVQAFVVGDVRVEWRDVHSDKKGIFRKFRDGGYDIKKMSSVLSKTGDGGDERLKNGINKPG